ncbi:hypothetical protein KKC04_03790 [Patescibacteria group bacterium]|nr:hypothetical protein [Patescibacteria group bacterium]
MYNFQKGGTMVKGYKNKGNVYIPVEIAEGLFSNEYAVTIELADGTYISLYANKNLVNDFDGQYFLKVALVKDTEKRVLLPSEAFETSTRWATVSNLKFA